MTDSPKPIRILVVDDHPLICQGIRLCVGTTRHMEIVGEAHDGQHAVDLARILRPDVVIMDVNMPRLNGLAATAAMVRDRPATRVLILTVHEDQEYIMEIMRAGAWGYLSKCVQPEELLRVIDKIATGERNFGLTETARYLRLYLPAAPCTIALPVKALTDREREVVSMIAQGLTNREMADQLGVAVRTVETFRERLMRKLDLHDAGALRSYASAHGLLEQKPDVSIGD